MRGHRDAIRALRPRSQGGEIRDHTWGIPVILDTLAARVRPRIDTDWGLLGVTSWPARGPAPFGRLSAGRRSRGRFRGAAPSHRSPGVSRAARAGWGVSSDQAWCRLWCERAAPVPHRRAGVLLCSQARFELADERGAGGRLSVGLGVVPVVTLAGVLSLDSRIVEVSGGHGFRSRAGVRSLTRLVVARASLPRRR